jgi:hypothetical protein
MQAKTQGGWLPQLALAIPGFVSGCGDSCDGTLAERRQQTSHFRPALELPSVMPRASGQETRPRLITFDDLEIDLPPGGTFTESLLTERIRELDGCRIHIRGFMVPSFQQAGIREFVMVKNTECRFGPGEPPHHVMMVVLRAGQTAAFTVRPLAVEGRFSISLYTGPDGSVWSLYRLEDARIQ